MPYSSNQDLPPQVRTHLPDHAQAIFRKAFNAALDEYKDEARAFQVAWAAVKKKYIKAADGAWIEKE